MAGNTNLAFGIEKTSNGWVVRLSQRDFTVQSQPDAEMIAAVPVELAKFDPHSPENPDLARSQKILDVCVRYSLYRLEPAVRALHAKMLSSKSRTPGTPAPAVQQEQKPTAKPKQQHAPQRAAKKLVRR